jgi:hypothetical protein
MLNIGGTKIFGVSRNFPMQEGEARISPRSPGAPSCIPSPLLPEIRGKCRTAFFGFSELANPTGVI